MSSPSDRKVDTSGKNGGVLRIDSYAETRRTGLLLRTDTPLEIWKQLGEKIAIMADSSAWWLGDWLVYGQKRYADRYESAIAQTSLDYGTLRNYAWIARKFKINRRRAALSFQHHVEVAALPEPDQDKWLEMADKFGWSRNRLRRELKNAGSNQPAQVEEAVHVQLRVALDCQKRWAMAAERTGTTLTEWIVGALDHAALTALGNSESGSQSVQAAAIVSSRGHATAAAQVIPKPIG